jgi:hypothetical protein
VHIIIPAPQSRTICCSLGGTFYFPSGLENFEGVLTGNIFERHYGQGGAFGIGIAMSGTNTARLAVVDDNNNDIIVIDQNL